MHWTPLDVKKARLEAARIALKAKFFGIDGIIDQVLAGINSWYFFPEYQHRPLLINLWGMTGVGKSDLVKNLVELLGLEPDFYAFDCGELSGRNVNLVRNVLAPLNELKPTRPQVLFFDEFQLMRTLSETGSELTHENSRAVWHLLDSGKIQLLQDWYMINERIFSIYRELVYQVQQGLEIREGMVSEDAEDFLIAKHAIKFHDSSTAEWKEFISKPKNRLALSSGELSDIYELPTFRLLPKGALEAKIKTLNGPELLAWLKQELDLYTKPSQLDLSNSLIFIAGNLDEVYHFSSSQSPDISPEYYHAKSLKITIQDVKKALLKRFRVEQVARLGNNHLIYPSLNSAAYRAIIEQELARIHGWTFSRSGIHFHFSERVKEWIYREGVAPTQGVRPLKSSIRYSVEDQLSLVLADVALLSESVQEVLLDYEQGKLLVDFFGEGERLAQKSYPIMEKIGLLRKATKDEQQALTAVHESGHAVVHLALFHQVPDLVLSVAAESGSLGMVVVQPLEVLNLEKMKRRASVFLAGQEAERLVFGEELLSTGSYSDIEQATSLVISLLKESGFGGIGMRYANSFGEYSDSYHDTREIEDKAKEILQEAQMRAFALVRQEEKLLLEMAAILSEHPSLSADEVSALVKQYGTEALKEGILKQELGYKERLAQKVKSLQTPSYIS
jgi:hypothetical protein